MGRRLLLLLLCLAARDCSAAGRYKSRIVMNPDTRGYEDIVLVVDDQLPRRKCKEVLHNIQVGQWRAVGTLRAQ